MVNYWHTILTSSVAERLLIAWSKLGNPTMLEQVSINTQSAVLPVVLPAVDWCTSLHQYLCSEDR